MFHWIPCLTGVTPVNMLVWEGSVTDSAVVRAQKVKLALGNRRWITGVSARSSKSGRHPSMLMIRTRLMAGTGRVVGKSAAMQQLQISQKHPNNKESVYFMFDRVATPYRVVRRT